MEQWHPFILWVIIRGGQVIPSTIFFRDIQNLCRCFSDQAPPYARQGAEVWAFFRVAIKQSQRLALASGKEADLAGHAEFQSELQNFQLFLILFSFLLRNSQPEGAVASPPCRQCQIFFYLHIGGSSRHRVLKHAPQIFGPFIFRQLGHIDAVYAYCTRVCIKTPATALSIVDFPARFRQ